MKTNLSVFLFVLVVALPGAALASPQGVLLEICEYAAVLARWLVGVGYVVSAITLARMGTSAALMGRFPAPNFVTWGAALFFLSMTPLVLNFLTSGSFGYQC